MNKPLPPPVPGSIISRFAAFLGRSPDTAGVRSCVIWRRYGGRSGWSMPSGPSPGRRPCSPIWPATPIGSPSPTAGCWRWTRRESPSATKTIAARAPTVDLPSALQLVPLSLQQAAGAGGAGGRRFHCRRDTQSGWNPPLFAHPGAITPVIAPDGIIRLARAPSAARIWRHDRAEAVRTARRRPAGTQPVRRSRGGAGRRSGRPDGRRRGRDHAECRRPSRAGDRAGVGPQRRGAGDAARLPGRLGALRRLVRAGRVHPGAGRPGDGRRLSRQPQRHPCADHDPPAAVGDRQDAPVQRPAVEPVAPRHPGAAAGAAAPARPPGAESRGAVAGPAAPSGRHLRPQRPRPARSRHAAVRLRRRAAPF